MRVNHYSLHKKCSKSQIKMREICVSARCTCRKVYDSPSERCVCAVLMIQTRHWRTAMPKQQFHFKHRLSLALSPIFLMWRALIIRLHIFGGAYFNFPGDRLTHPHTHAHARNGFHLEIFDFWILTGMPNTSHRAHDLLSLNKYLWRLRLPMCAID